MTKFEIVLIFSPDLASNILDDEIENFKKMLESNSAAIINYEDWGLRDLSYNINKFKKGFYSFFQIETSGNIVKSVSKDLIQSETLLRYLFIKVKEHQELPTKLNNEKK